MTQTLIFAHRGANREAAENTRSAFDRALDYAIDGMETDVQLSRDEVAVLWHDRFLNKLGLPDQHIDDFEFDQLRTMNFSAHFSASSQAESLMTLKEFLDRYRTRCRLLMEIKNRDWEIVLRHEIKIREALKLVGNIQDDSIMISSFNLASLVYAQRCTPGFPLIYNLEPEQTLEEVKSVLNEQTFLHGLCLPIDSLDENWINVLRDKHKLIAVYTCNSELDIQKAIDLKVDILISDLPQKALQIRRSKS
jgi:glycerophosphoryl diester phosphodiesterase